MQNKTSEQTQQKKLLQGKKKWIVIAVVVVIILAAIGNRLQSQQPDSSEIQNSSDTLTPQESITNDESTATEPNANTSAKVDALALAAKNDVEENGVSEEKRDEAVAFVVSHYPDFYTSNDIMEQAIYYGYWLEYAYYDDESARDYANLGMDLEQAVKYVYRGNETVEDAATQENLNQIQESLEAIGQDVE